MVAKIGGSQIVPLGRFCGDDYFEVIPHDLPIPMADLPEIIDVLSKECSDLEGVKEDVKEHKVEFVKSVLSAVLAIDVWDGTSETTSTVGVFNPNNRTLRLTQTDCISIPELMAVRDALDHWREERETKLFAETLSATGLCKSPEEAEHMIDKARNAGGPSTGSLQELQQALQSIGQSIDWRTWIYGGLVAGAGGLIALLLTR